MDALTYVVLAGWVLMYFVPSGLVAAAIAGLMALFASHLISLQSGPAADPTATLLPVALIAFVAIYVAWPLGAAMRWLKRRVKGAGA
ncbi:MAG: hypothetical protein AAGO57_00295 [Pseudomonadota bacterium]